jgi:hypothetical protein
MGILVLVLLAPLNLLLRRRLEKFGLEPDGAALPRNEAVGNLTSNVVDAAWVAADWTLDRALRTDRYWSIAAGYSAACLPGTRQIHQTEYLVDIGSAPRRQPGHWGWVAIPGQVARPPLRADRPRMGLDPRGAWRVRPLLFRARRPAPRLDAATDGGRSFDERDRRSLPARDARTRRARSGAGTRRPAAALCQHRLRDGLLLDPSPGVTDRLKQIRASLGARRRRHARHAGIPVRSPRLLLRALEAIREVAVIEPGSRGRPRVRRQLEDLDPPAERLAACFGFVAPVPAQ